jgi:hypothetical protein
VLDRIEISSGSKDENSKRIDVQIPRGVLKDNKQDLDGPANPRFYKRLERALKTADPAKHGIKFAPSWKQNQWRIKKLLWAHEEAKEQPYEPGPFPIKALSHRQRRLCLALKRAYRAPIEIPAMAALAVTAAALGKGWKLTEAVEGRENFGNVYVMIAAPTGGGKKAVEDLAKPILEASDSMECKWIATEMPELKAERDEHKARARHLVQRHARGGLSPKESVANHSELVKINKRLDEITALLNPGSGSLWIGDSTSPALKKALAANNGTLLAYAPEGGEIVKIMLGQYTRGGDFDLWLSGYSVERKGSARAGSGKVNIEPCLTSLICCQPRVLRKLLRDPEALDRGFVGRVLAFITDRSFADDDRNVRGGLNASRKAWGGLIARLLETRLEALKSNETRVVKCSRRAQNVLSDFHHASNDLLRGPFTGMRDIIVRWRENACRIALGICVADDPNGKELSGRQAERAVQIARWAQLSTLKAVVASQMQWTEEQSEAAENGRREELIEKLKERGGKATLRILEQNCGFPRNEVKLLIAKSERFDLKTEKKPRGGRWSNVLYLIDSVK